MNREFDPDIMTDTELTPFETLKEILRHARNPERLGEHPWTRSLFVQEALERDPQLAQAGPGQQLVSAIAGLFPQLRPANPPRQGLRLDPRWGEFGLLGALYFMPYNNGTSFPTSHLDAWRRIDPAILYYVYGKPAEDASEEQIQKYRLIGDELENGSASTLSDWHRKGLQRLAEAILNRERYLARSSAQPSTILPAAHENNSNEAETSKSKQSSWLRRILWLSLALCLVLALGLGALKAWKVYQRGRLVYQDVARLRGLRNAPIGLETLDRAGPIVSSLQVNLAAFKQEAGPFLWLAPGLAWLPAYGGDLAAAADLIALAEHLVDAADLSLQAAQPLLSELNTGDAALGPAGLTGLLVQAQPQLLEAQKELERAFAARNKIPVEGLSPRLQTLLVDELDPLLPLADQGLSLAVALPSVLGATSAGPKTYLLLAQNEDELRPTGGFITSVGNLVVHNGRIISLEFEGVDNQVQEDWSKPYPVAPWQLQEYMNSRVLILRDSNWFTDFPTTVLWAEYLYAYTHAHSVDGVIAFDQQFLVMLLRQLGPLKVDGAPYPLTAENVVEFMRTAKAPPAGEPVPLGWDRKEFIGEIADALLEELSRGQKTDWPALAKVISQALAERHLLLQMDDPALTTILAEQGWDGAVRPGNTDFLMTVDTNIGFNKTNALVNVGLSYDVDLSDIKAPKSTLLVAHYNDTRQDIPCIHWNTSQIGGEVWYPVNRCYWNYLRVYKQTEVELLDASPHLIPGAWMLLGESVPARVDELEEEVEGVQGFGTLLVVPGGQTVNTGFTFALPASVLSPVGDSGEFVYRLKIQKQPGTLANPVTIRVHLPERAVLKSVSSQAVIQENNLLIETDLRNDIKLEVVFIVP